MDKLMRNQSGGGTIAGGDRAVREYQYYYHGAGGLVDQEMGVAAPSEAADDVDGVVLLMELLDEVEEVEGHYSPAPVNVDGDADRLSCVIRSLEAEIGGGVSAPAAAAAMRDDSTGAAGPASDVDGEAAGISRLEDMFSDDLDDGYGGGPFGYSWPPELPLPAEGSWCVYSDDEHLYYGDGSVDEQVYSPLWEQ